jgi:hypothetical protein
MEDEDEAIGGLGSAATGAGIADLMTPALSLPDARGAYTKAQGAVEAQIRANMDALNAARERLRAKRVGPSDAEKWFAIAGALGQPTRTGSLGETMGNLGSLLGKYSGAKREAEEEQQSLLDKYGMQVGTEQLRLLQSGATGAAQMLRAALTQDAARARAEAGQFYSSPNGGLIPKPGTGGQPAMPTIDNDGVYVITDPRQLQYLRPNTPIRRPNDPTVKYTRAAPGG